MKQLPLRALLCALAIASSPLQAAAPPAAPPAAPQVPAQVSNAAWEQDMQRFAASDAQQPPPKHGIVFVGSSSIRFWETLAQDFPGKPVINRGFGGSEVRDSTWYADRIVIPYAPRQVVLYAGDNDLNSGRSPEQVRDDVVAFVTRIRAALPEARIGYLSIKPSPSRAQLLPAIVRANQLIKQALAKVPRTDYIDIYTPMLDATGKPRPELFREDMLHMKPEGYALWRKAVAPVLERK
ncbi:SGNH/GDSL hydrolase family protein [Xanthomonas campestris pv. raphani]|uniref:SGNH/GDSL hydrolase family protein n=1 Tax=Xanthomonas campestris TaxID=339 RepID=UPI002B236428|nr:SGNH/GDSL hydrolase family protein [Xanthomonas campestris]MEA9829389.1 SGNH/GDSL hydrolase family protein [Xanthomonas campestris pv. raphani]